MKSIEIKVILKRIKDCFQQIEQWENMKAYARCSEYMYQAKSLIELIEVFDCGSTGGFSEGQKHSTRLKDRFNFLNKKYLKG